MALTKAHNRMIEGAAVNVKDFGAVGDGTTDDTTAIQAAFTYASENNLMIEEVAGIFLVNSPIVIDEFSGVYGNASNNQEAIMVIKAGASFTSTYTMTYYTSSTGASAQSYDVASILISKAWVDGDSIGKPIKIDKILLDGDSKKGSRNEPIHGFIGLCWASSIECNTANTTGFGVWLNPQLPNGSFSGNHVDNTFMGNRFYNSGVVPSGDSDPLSYTINSVEYFYGALHVGTLENSQDSSNTKSSDKFTDGFAINVIQAGTCSGTGIRVIDSGGWHISGCHLNGAGRHGIYIDGGVQSIITSNYVDGWGNDIEASEGDFYAIGVNEILGFSGSDANGVTTIADNRVRIRPITNNTGNKLIALHAKGSSAASGRCSIHSNSIVCRNDITSGTKAITYILGLIPSGGLEVSICNNNADENCFDIATNLHENQFGVTVVYVAHSGNTWQTVTARPTRWGVSGEIVYARDPNQGDPNYYQNTSTNNGSTWKAIGDSRKGTTADRPTLAATDAGFMYWDQTLVRPIFWSGSAWKYEDGTNV